ncbi:hypothetical protein C3488_36085 [Streptomyces sp. Ru72]|nr:hypothetical protein C3488_36085 [Streptomyces sp. Ru72]
MPDDGSGYSARMNDKHRNHGSDERRTAEQAAREQREAEEQRAASRPFEYPYPERRAGVRARRNVREEDADADMAPGVPGGYGTTGGGRPGGTGAARPPRPSRQQRGEGEGDTLEP